MRIRYLRVIGPHNSWLRNNQMKRASTTVRKRSYSILDSKRRQQQGGENAGDTAASAVRLDIVDVVIASNAFTDEELVDQMMTFLVA